MSRFEKIWKSPSLLQISTSRDLQIRMLFTTRCSGTTVLARAAARIAGSRQADPRHQDLRIWRFGDLEIWRKFGDLQILSRSPNLEISKFGNQFPGGHRSRVTPVPIPNTEVKPATADGTARVGAWESRSLPGIFRKQPVSSRVHGLFLCTPRTRPSLQDTGRLR